MTLVFKTIIIIYILFFLGCNNFKRFEQKKYFCNSNDLNIELIDILETRSIKKSYLTIKGKEYPTEILNINNDEISLKLNSIYIKINLLNNEITANDDNKVYFLKCDKSNFNI